MTTLTTLRDDALNLSTDLAQAGAVFNNSTRLLDGGLWKSPADANNQAAYLGLYTTDIHAVLNDVNAAIGNPSGVTVGGNAYALSTVDASVLSEVQGQLQTLLNDAPNSIGTSNSATTAQELIHTTQTSILDEISGDATLAAALGANPFPSGTGATNVGFQNLPTGSDTAVELAAATAPGATLAQIGNVFNAAADLAVGGLNHSNLFRIQRRHAGDLDRTDQFGQQLHRTFGNRVCGRRNWHCRGADEHPPRNRPEPSKSSDEQF